MSIKGLVFIVGMYFKRLIRAIFKAIWRFLSKRRYMGNHPRVKKAIMLTFLSINAIAWIVVPNYILLNGPKEIIIIERVGVSVSSEVAEACDSPDDIADNSDLIREEATESLNSSPEVSVEDKICAVFPDNCELMIAIAKAESGLNPNAYHLNNNGSEDIGLFMINDIHGLSKEERYDIDRNISFAKELYERDGLTPWVVYNTGAYKKFLNS